MTQHDLDLATIGHDSGFLVLHLERRVSVASGPVWRALAACEHPKLEARDGDGVHWEVDELTGGTRLAFTTWIDGTEVEAAAAIAAGYHARFERLVSMIDGGTGVPALDEARVAMLADRYVDAFSAALADTD